MEESYTTLINKSNFFAKWFDYKKKATYVMSNLVNYSLQEKYNCITQNI